MVLGVLYYSTPPYENLQFIGAIANTRPRCSFSHLTNIWTNISDSDIFHTGFPLNPHVNEQKEIKLIM